MSVFGIFGDAFSGILEGVNSLVSKFKLSPKEQEAFELQVKALLQQQHAELEATYRKEVEAKMEIMKAELVQGDTYTKRARPTIVYAGLIFIFIVHVLFPIIVYLSGHPVPDIQLPDDFWWAWGSVVSVYGIGRSVEKFGAQNKVTNLITGTDAYKLNKEKLVKG
ncbi:conserved hypothetical protein [Chloroherpeton thalassium ATCC 35110]|uniref:Holin of 3TMs, for gene-transfer release n=1 Tax=Chloroherpeton thalassium (strain ATCC 35110 / GB-78) TaxID=517418 RepID=B3QXY3_CHLT3|nr:holin family protein [Chloroherpeton thalassium]ACF13511.1 conserved hypothetical protein [Chloroherpeton thalassium ATCC 35110]